MERHPQRRGSQQRDGRPASHRQPAQAIGRAHGELAEPEAARGAG
ncbi:MAG TPA: hypothetical protein PLF73_02025 [Luteimonas sp.]|nr:hypothetical protein [Luteimonas sp.]